MVHIPKTAGTSFRKSVREIFGESMILDYADKPIKVKRWKRNWRTWLQGRRSNALTIADNTCIFGHYMPLKYSQLARTRECRMITWLRDPIERMVSHYRFVFEHHRLRKLAPGQSQIVDENWTLEQFMFSPRYRNYSSQFLWGVGLKKFDFVGLVEHYEEDLADFGMQYFGRTLTAHREKQSLVRPPCPFLDDPQLRAVAERFHACDMRIYRQAFEMRAKRLAKASRCLENPAVRAAA
jgi:Sulfotransferase family